MGQFATLSLVLALTAGALHTFGAPHQLTKATSAVPAKKPVSVKRQAATIRNGQKPTKTRQASKKGRHTYAAIALRAPLMTAQQNNLKYSNIPSELLNPTDHVDRVAALISSNEGEPTDIVWNDNGRGISVGMFQANQRVGELPAVLHEFASTEDGYQELQESFGNKFADQIVRNPESVRRVYFNKNNSMGKGMQKLVSDPGFQELQVSILRRKIVRAAELAAEHGITSSAGVTMCADLINQWGEGGARRFLRAAKYQRSEQAKAQAIVAAVRQHNSRYAMRYQDNLAKLPGNGLSFADRFEP